jgi:hypothetical protein
MLILLDFTLIRELISLSSEVSLPFKEGIEECLVLLLIDLVIIEDFLELAL